MFGNNAVTSSWANPQQNQQQQQQQPAGASAFGQPNAFGSGAFGSGGAFGQTQQQQPQANPMFGNLGGSTNPPATNSGFGAFGSTPAQNNTSNPIFGAPKPATGFGAFGGGGGTGTFGSGGAFGSSATNTAGTSNTGSSLFGSNATAGTSAFGGSGAFGGNKTATGFVATAPPPSGSYDTVAPVTTGSSNPPFTPFSEKDTNANSNVTLHYQTITSMPAYRGCSFEELRMQDYQQGRKTAGAFGQSATFGGAPQSNPSTNVFGAPTQQNPPQSTLFGGGGSGGAFGSNAQPTTNAFGGSAFGQNNTSLTTPASGTSAGTGLFGGFGQQQQQQQPATGFSSFGQNQQQPATGGGAFGTGAFGTTQNKPASGFGAFGSGNTNTGGGFGSGGLFGQQNQQQQQQQQPAATGGLFGQSQPQQQQLGTGGFGGFGTANTNAPKPGGIFGQSTAQPAQQTGSGFGLFGGAQPQQPQQNAQQPASGGLFGGGGLFGQNNAQQQQQPQNQTQQGGLFGNTQPTQQPTGGLFGNTGGGSLFGNNNTQQNQQPPPANGFGLFGAPKTTTPAAPSGGIFGNNTFGQQGTNSNNPSTLGQQSNSLFGNTLGQSTTQQPSGGLFSGGSSLFKPAAPVLGTSQSTQGGFGGSLFGSTLGNSTLTASASNAGAQGSLTASIAQPIGANLPIFSMLPPGPRAITLDQQPKKKPGFFIDVPTRSPVPRLQLGYTPANTKLRGFASQASSSSLSNGGNPFSSSVSFTSGKPNALSLSRTVDNKASVGPDAFLGRSGSPALGSGGRQSVKKLILDKKVEPSDLFSKSGGGSPGALRTGLASKVTFSPALGVAAREKEAADATNALKLIDSPTPTRNLKLLDRSSAQSQEQVPPAAAQEPQEGDYWVKPDLNTLKNTGYEELSAFNGLIVGRVGYGEINFLEPVDLTGLPKLGALLGQLIRFDDKECSVYPDSDDVDKPPPGSGLNVRARIILVRCWALDKATREPIKDENHQLAVRHLKRLKNMKNTHFEGFDIVEGKWTFTVDRF